MPLLLRDFHHHAILHFGPRLHLQVLVEPVLEEGVDELVLRERLHGAVAVLAEAADGVRDGEGGVGLVAVELRADGEESVGDGEDGAGAADSCGAVHDRFLTGV